MSILTIILFFLYSYGLGFTITSFVKTSENFLERNMMRIGLGLAMLPFLGVLLHLFRVPLDWKIFLILALIYPIIALIKNYKRITIKGFKLRIRKSDMVILVVLVLFALTFFMYVSGAFKYPYLEDHDPYIHAMTAKYVSVEKTVTDPLTYDFPYIDPYPPAYAMIMGILHQTSSSLMWTLKFFNALVISLGILFFYFFAKEFMRNRNKALFATFILAAIPSYLSHFIWAHSLIPTLLFVALYCLEQIKNDKKWIYPSIIAISSFPLVQPTQAIKMFVFLGIYTLVKSLIERKFFIRNWISFFGGYIIAALFWWVPNGRWTSMFGSFAGQSKTHSQVLVEEVKGSFNIISKLRNAFPADSGTATRAYTFDDFFVAKSQNMINNPIGIGVVISILLIISLIVLLYKYKSLIKKENCWISITLLWLIFTFLGINSMTFNLPVGLFAFRFWMLFAIPVALISVEGTWYIAGLLRRFGVGKVITITLIIVGVILTAGYQKYAVNTAMWMPPLGGLVKSTDELQGYIDLKGLEPDTKVFSFCPDSYITITSFDKFICSWCEDENMIIGNKDSSSEEIYNLMKDKDYDYLLVDSNCVLNFGVNETNEKASDIVALNKFQLVVNKKGFLLFRVL